MNEGNRVGLANRLEPLGHASAGIRPAALADRITTIFHTDEPLWRCPIQQHPRPPPPPLRRPRIRDEPLPLHPLRHRQPQAWHPCPGVTPLRKGTARAEWPATLPERLRAVRQALTTHCKPATAAEIAGQFSWANKARVAELLETLVAVGQAGVITGGEYVR